MKTYLLTGGAGFIGSNMVLYLLARYEDIRIIDLDALTYAGSRENLKAAEGDGRHIFVRGDIRDEELVSRLLAEYDPDVVLNFAAESHVDRSIEGPSLFADTNVGGTVRLLQCCRRAWYDSARGTWREGKRFLQISTDEVYGSLGPEGLFTEETPLSPHSPYSASKASADLFVTAFRDTYGMPVNITRCSNNFGPRQFPEKLIPLMICSAVQHRPLPVYGDGLQVRDWLYVEDHCRAVDLVAEKGRAGEIYNIGGRSEIANLALVKILLSKLRERLADDAIDESLISFTADRPGHDRRYGIDAGKIRRELGWEPLTPFDEGLEKTVDWYLADPRRARSVITGAFRGAGREGGTR